MDFTKKVNDFGQDGKLTEAFLKKSGIIYIN